MNQSSWIWKGATADMRHPLRALLMAPLLAALPGLGAVIFWGSKGGISIGVLYGFLWVIGCSIAVAYALTLIFGLPAFWGLSRIGMAGLVPVLITGIVPAIIFHLFNRNALTITAISLMCGFLVSGGFWFVARQQ